MPKNAFAFKTLNFDSTSLQLHTKHETSREEDKVLKTLKKHVTRVNAALFFFQTVLNRDVKTTENADMNRKLHSGMF